MRHRQALGGTSWGVVAHTRVPCWGWLAGQMDCLLTPGCLHGYSPHCARLSVWCQMHTPSALLCVHTCVCFQCTLPTDPVSLLAVLPSCAGSSTPPAPASTPSTSSWTQRWREEASRRQTHGQHRSVPTAAAAVVQWVLGTSSPAQHTRQGRRQYKHSSTVQHGTVQPLGQAPHVGRLNLCTSLAC